MHMIFRFIILFFKSRLRPRVKLGEITEVTMRVLPTDLDFLMHVNNGVYFSYMDFGRMDMIFRNGMYENAKRQGYYGVVAAETIKFRRSLELGDKFTIQTETRGHDGKYFFIRQKFFKKGELMATGLVKIRFLKKSGGVVSSDDVLVGFKDLPPNKIDDLGKDWQDLESKYLM